MGVPVAEVLPAVRRDHPRVVDGPVGPVWATIGQRFPSGPTATIERRLTGAYVHLRHRSPVCRLPLEAVLSTRRTGSSPQWLCSGGTQGHPRDRRPGAPPTARIVRLGAPLLALVLALLGVHPFTIISTSLTPIGGASSAAALLFVGITVARTRHPRLSPAVWAIALTGVIAQPLLTASDSGSPPAPSPPAQR
jgi:hypothetical protein